MPDAATSIAGATPWGAAAQIGLGALQTGIGAIRAHRAQKQLENMQSPTYVKNQSILDYYSKALQKYNLSPYETAGYKKNVQDVGRGTTTALDALRGRGGAVAGVNNIIASANDNILKAGVDAENRKAQEFNVLGNATGMKAGEDRRAFDINQQQPFERKYNLLAMKASGGNKVEGAGISNIFGGFGAYNDSQLAKKIYGK